MQSNRRNRCAWSRTQRLMTACLIGMLVLLAGAAHAQAQTFPARPIRLVVGFPPGASDMSARIVAQKLSDILGQPVVVENRPGAAGNIAAAHVATAQPDGYTILLAVNSYTINTTVYRNLTWDLLRDFTPIGRYASSPMVVVVNNTLPVTSVDALIDYAKRNPDVLNYGSAGTGTAPHLAGELFTERTDIRMVHVPYKGSAPSVTALMANEIQVAFGAMSAFSSAVQSGRIRPLAVTTAQRFVQLPDVPTVIESGIDDFSLDIWYGLLAPANTPTDVIQTLSAALRDALADPVVSQRLRDAGLDVAYLDRAATARLVRQDVARWAELAQRLNLILE